MAGSAECNLRLRLHNGSVSTEQVRRAVGKGSPIGSHPGRVVAHFVGWSCNADGTDIACEDTGCLSTVTGPSGFTLPPVDMTLPRVSQQRPLVGMTMRLLHEPEGSNNGFQIVAETVLPLSVRTSAAFLRDNQITTYKDNDCFYRQGADPSRSPLEHLVAAPHKCAVSGAPLRCDDYAHNLFPWENPDIEVGHWSGQIECLDGHKGANPPDPATQADLRELIKEDEGHMRSMWRRGADWFQSMFERGKQTTASGAPARVQYSTIYQQLVPCARKTLQCHQAAHQLNPNHCKADADVLLQLARIGARLTGQTFEDYVAQCKQQPAQAIAGAHAEALKVAASATHYMVDYSCGKPSERFTNMWGLFSALNHAGFDCANAGADCEDYGYFISKLHTAYASLGTTKSKQSILAELEAAGEADPKAGTAALMAIGEAARNYSAFPITCSTYDASAHGDVVEKASLFQSTPKKAAHVTHTYAQLIPESTIEGMKSQRPAEPAQSTNKSFPVVLLEGTALVSANARTLHKARNSGQPLPIDRAAMELARKSGADVSFPIPMQGSHFYAYANQLIHSKEGVPNGYICVTRDTGKLGVPFKDFITDPLKHCRLEQMYSAPSAQEQATNRRFLAGRCPPFKLNSTRIRNAGQRAVASRSLPKVPRPLASAIPMGPWGVIRGVLPSSAVCTALSEIALTEEPIAQGLRLVLYTEPKINKIA